MYRLGEVLYQGHYKVNPKTLCFYEILSDVGEAPSASFLALCSSLENLGRVLPKVQNLSRRLAHLMAKYGIAYERRSTPRGVAFVFRDGANTAGLYLTYASVKPAQPSVHAGKR